MPYHNLDNEKNGWNIIQSLRREVETDFVRLRESVSAMTKEECLERGAHTVQEVLRILRQDGLHVENADPGHAVGHVVRDYVNAIRLVTRLDADPRALFIGFVAGALHDIGCSVVSRYAESRRSVRHAEVAALILDRLFAHETLGLNRAEQVLIMYAVAAHTHYLKPVEVVDTTGETRTIQPYMDTDLRTGQALLEICLPRWIDRLECSGPTFIGRHYLTLVKDHEDFDGQKFHIQSYDIRMIPERRADCRYATFLEHLYLYVDSQNNRSPYGRFDFGRMVELRDANLTRMKRIIAAVEGGAPINQDWETVESAWTDYLCRDVEPTKNGVFIAEQLAKRFHNLPAVTRRTWIAGFYRTMREYQGWAAETLADLEGVDPAWLKLPGISDDIREMVRPDGSWTTKLAVNGK